MPLTLTRMDPDDRREVCTHWSVRHGDRYVGSIHQRHGGPQDGHWSWSITDPRVDPAVNNRGTEATKDEAKRAFAARWRACLAAKGLEE